MNFWPIEISFPSLSFPITGVFFAVSNLTTGSSLSTITSPEAGLEEPIGFTI